MSILTDEQATKRNIVTSLSQCANGDFRDASLRLLNSLGYTSDKRLELSQRTFDGFREAFDRDGKLNPTRARSNQWHTVDLLFQITADEVTQTAQQRLAFTSAKQMNPALFESYLFFAIDLSNQKDGKPYSRTALAEITREINRCFLMPAMLLFRHTADDGKRVLTLAVINRRPNKRDADKDVLEKISLIKDINCDPPHAAHREILWDLSLHRLTQERPIHSFLDLHTAWQTALDTRELNKTFYQKLATWFDWAKELSSFPKDTAKYSDVSDSISVIRLLTRIIFCWFMKERDLIESRLFEQSWASSVLKGFSPDDITSDQSHYYKAILQNLFFATLSVPDKQRRFREKRSFRGKNADFGNDDVYRFASLFNETETFQTFFEQIPFLNGGLFECLDKKAEKVYVDGFSDDPKHQPTMPDALFFSKNSQQQGLFHILNGFKFTIEENTPIEEEVALDPELLGKVFENLLATYNPETGVTARKQTGSFYTPREIVGYMADEALFDYLRRALAKTNPSTGSDAEQKARHLLNYDAEEQTYMLPPEEKRLLVEAISNLKVLDPACGSGAFPMGVLQKLVFVLQRLDKDNALWRQHQRERAVRETEHAYKLIDQTARQKRLMEIDEVFEENTQDYGRKLYLIENCIFGADIQTIAVHISKLRFFISLLVDQKIDRAKPNFGIRPLPNLETKFVAANTLVSVIRGQRGLMASALDEKEAELRVVRHLHFRAQDPTEKDALRSQDEALRDELAKLHEQAGDFSKESARELATWNPYDQNTTAGFFDAGWMFLDVEEGFDIVIGNPPYMRVQGLQQTQAQYMPYYRDHFKSAKGGFDLYALFIERGYELLKPTGCLAYIVPHKFFQASFGHALRLLLTNKQALRQIVRFGAAQVFEEATTYTCLLFLSAQPQAQFDLLEVRSLTNGERTLHAARNRAPHEDYAFTTLPAPTVVGGDAKRVDWDFAIGDQNRVLERLRQHKESLGSITRKIFQGIPTGADKVFVLQQRDSKSSSLIVYSKYLEQEIEIEKAFTKPFLMGKDVHRYESIQANNVVIFPYQMINGQAKLINANDLQRQFPKGWNYLQRCRDVLAERENGRFAITWYAFSRPQNLTEFEAVKLITPDICDGPQMSVDESGKLYHTTTLYSFVFNEKAKGSAKFFLGVLNSQVMWYFISVTGAPLRGNYYRFKSEYLKPFPIAESTQEQQRMIETLVEYVLWLKAQAIAEQNRDRQAIRDVMAAYFEQLIDAVVYEMYFPEEFLDAHIRVSELLVGAGLPALGQNTGDPFSALQNIFNTLYERNHPVRRALFFLNSVEAVRIIESKVNADSSTGAADANNEN